MIVIFIRTLIIFITLTIIIRLMGKRQIGEMQPFEFIVTLIIADLACVPMADVSIPLLYGIVSIVALFILHQLFSIIEQKSSLCKKIISGKPSIVINKNGVDIKQLKKNNLGIDDLIESMRAQGYFSLDDLDYAIFESNGKLSALEKKEISSPNSIPLLIINEGKIEKENIEKLKVSERDIYEFLFSNGTSIKNTDILTIDGNGKVYLQKSNCPYEILAYSLKEGVKW